MVKSPPYAAVDGTETPGERTIVGLVIKVPVVPSEPNVLGGPVNFALSVRSLPAVVPAPNRLVMSSVRRLLVTPPIVTWKVTVEPTKLLALTTFCVLSERMPVELSILQPAILTPPLSFTESNVKVTPGDRLPVITGLNTRVLLLVIPDMLVVFVPAVKPVIFAASALTCASVGVTVTVPAT